MNAFVALGTNLDRPIWQLERAVGWLRAHPDIHVVASARPLWTAPVGPPQPTYLNSVTQVRTSLPPVGLLRVLQRLERAAGRLRSATAVRWGARTLDLDLLLFGDRVLDHPDLTLPHPALHERRFVLAPLAQIAPTLRHPLLDRTVTELLEDLG